MMECRYCGRFGSAETCRGCGAPYDMRAMQDPAYARRNRVNNAIQSSKDRRLAAMSDHIGGMSRKSVLEHLGETDPEVSVKEWVQKSFPYESYKAHLRALELSIRPEILVTVRGDMELDYSEPGGRVDVPPGSTLLNWRSDE